MPAIMGIDFKLDQLNTANEVGGGTSPFSTIVAISPGYYTNSSNGGFTPVGPESNTVSAVNDWLAETMPSWAVADGSEVYDEDSPIYNESGRHLPNLTDSRFTAGSTSAGSQGGANTQKLGINNLPEHEHNGSTGSSTPGNHTHGMNGPSDGHWHRYYRKFGNDNEGYWYGETFSSSKTRYSNWNAPALASNDHGDFNHKHSTGSGGNHAHNIGGALSYAGGNSSFSIIPVYLDAFYIIRYK